MGQPSDRKPLQVGFQSELVLIIADQQPVKRDDLLAEFSGDSRQFKNALHNLRTGGLVTLQSGLGYELTDDGLYQAKFHAAARRHPASPIKKPEAPLIHLVKPKPEGLTKKLDFLSDMKRLLSAELSDLVSSIEADLMDFYGEQK